MSDLPLTVDEIRGSVADYESALADVKAAIVAAETDPNVDDAGMIELIKQRNAIIDIMKKLGDLADEQDAA